MVTNTLLRLLMRASLRRKAGRPRKYATVCAQLRSPNTDRLCTRAKELAKKHVVGGDLSADARSLLIQLRAAIRAGSCTVVSMAIWRYGE